MNQPKFPEFGVEWKAPLVFVVLYNGRSIFLFQYTVIHSYGICLQINCVVTKDLVNHCFFLTGTQCFWTGTRDFSQDEFQDSPADLILRVLSS